VTQRSRHVMRVQREVCDESANFGWDTSFHNIYPNF
jgi:hypothetical protein